MRPRLGINIDHVATLRQAREENYPSLVDAAHMCLDRGADQITIHLREDRRHIQDIDVPAVGLVCKKFGRPLNLEMGHGPEIIQQALEASPEWICLVPERREERTTEGGLALHERDTFTKVKETMDELRAKLTDTKISLFLQDSINILEKCVELRPNAVEIHTGDFARAHNEGDDLAPYFDQFSKAKEFLSSQQIGVHAGHGLTDKSTKALVEKGLFEEYNIGHWVICQSVFEGLPAVVSKLVSVFSDSVYET